MATQVVKKAELIAPSGSDLLLGISSSYTVKTNKDHTNTVVYTLVDGYDVMDITRGTFYSHSCNTPIYCYPSVYRHTLHILSRKVNAPYYDKTILGCRLVLGY